MLKKILATFLAGVLAVGFVSCGKNEDMEEKNYTSADVAAESENFQFTRAELSYLFYQNYQSFLQQNQSYMQYIGIDTSASLKDQSYSEDVTWFAYFMQETTEDLHQILALCEAAKAAGIELDDEDQAEIEAVLASYTKYAEDYEFELDALLKREYGADISFEALRTCLEKLRLSIKYQDMLVSGYDFNDSDFTAYLEEHNDAFYCVDYLSYTFDEDTAKDAAEKAQELAAITDAAAFEAYVRTFETEFLGRTENEMDLSDMSHAFALKDAKNSFSTWAFGSAQPGTTYVDKNEVDGIYTVYLLTKTPYLQDYTTKNFRYVYLTLDTYGSYDKLLERANELVNTWQAGDADADSFGKLAFDYSEDGATGDIGGIYENLGMAPSKFPDAVVTWLYDENRQAGDVEVIRGDQAYFIVYFEGDGQIQWKNQAQTSLSEKQFAADMKEFREKYEMKTYDKVMDSLTA